MHFKCSLKPVWGVERGLMEHRRQKKEKASRKDANRERRERGQQKPLFGKRGDKKQKNKGEMQSRGWVETVSQEESPGEGLAWVWV